MFLRIAATISAMAAVAVAIIVVGVGPRNVEPVQPVEFSHKVHAGEYKIDCFYCHINARRSMVAGIPSVQFCMGCHKNVGKDKLGVQTLIRYWEGRQPMQWIRINDLPDFVYFTHKRHVNADIACQECHGAVETMDVVKAAQPLTMERCVNCHLERRASIDCWTCHK